MKTIDVMFDINDIVYVKEYCDWNIKLKTYERGVVEKYIIRSISISCNSEGEWKKSYRVQRLNGEHITDIGFNFSESDVGKIVFSSLDDAEAVVNLENIGLQKLSMGE